MALGPTNRDYPDGWLECHPPGWQKEKEGPRLREAAVYRAGRRSCDWGARTIATSAHGHRGVTAARALYTPTVATAPWSVARSLISRNASASGVSSLPRMAPHLVVVLARKRSTTARWPRLSETSGISHPKGT
jgi:hypothetical protein